jgi:hypothetical protein
MNEHRPGTEAARATLDGGGGQSGQGHDPGDLAGHIDPAVR